MLRHLTFCYTSLYLYQLLTDMSFYHNFMVETVLVVLVLCTSSIEGFNCIGWYIGTNTCCICMKATLKGKKVCHEKYIWVIFANQVRSSVYMGDANQKWWEPLSLSYCFQHLNQWKRLWFTINQTLTKMFNLNLTI